MRRFSLLALAAAGTILLVLIAALAPVEPAPPRCPPVAYTDEGPVLPWTGPPSS